MLSKALYPTKISSNVENLIYNILKFNPERDYERNLLMISQFYVSILMFEYNLSLEIVA